MDNVILNPKKINIKLQKTLILLNSPNDFADNLELLTKEATYYERNTIFKLFQLIIPDLNIEKIHSVYKRYSSIKDKLAECLNEKEDEELALAINLYSDQISHLLHQLTQDIEKRKIMY